MSMITVGAAASKEPPKRKYEYSKQFFEKSIRSAIRDSIFSPISLGEKHDVGLKPNFNTACWAYLPPHNIYIGTELFEKPMVKDGLSDVLQAKYIANHYHHELGHALFTERNMKMLQRTLKTITCPFPLYNLFEDAYMEDRYRREAEYNFEWLTLETLELNPRPESLLFALIQAEGDVAVVQKSMDTWTPVTPDVDVADPQNALVLLFQPEAEDTRSTLKGMFERVQDYYRRITAVKQSMELMPLLKEWLDEFGRPPPMGNGQGPGGAMGDMQHSASLMTDPKARAKFEAEVEELSDEEPEDNPPEGGVKGKATAKENHEAISKKGKLLGTKEYQLDVSRAEALTTKFKKFFVEKSRVVSTRTPQRRMSARHFALDRAPYRRTELDGRRTRKVFLEIDCSGSMRGSHIADARLLVLTLSMLAKQGHIEGHVVLSGLTGGGAIWELFKLPMTPETISRIDANGGCEGLEYTLQDNIKLAQAADYVFVYTDGQISDKAIDKAKLHRYGVYTWGLYVGASDNYMENLIKYFDKGIMRQTIESLVDAMLIQQM